MLSKHEQSQYDFSRLNTAQAIIVIADMKRQMNDELLYVCTPFRKTAEMNIPTARDTGVPDKTAVVCDYEQYRVGVDIKSSESYTFLDILDKNRTKSHFLELSFPGMNHSCGFILALPYGSGSAMDYTPEGYDHVMLQTCFVDTGKTKLTTANNI
ncbi:hypothetical protein CLF_107980 [Clonorchis sinensis]|uniref:Uncharacterized protein n=1 Tax=Clonorchis sinensis TaxID=79923 RepID=G7YHG0_CLOSI|nr:hypothetical protein CLF_107980 [Clonorchis sinensis]